jgi:hypothetical protein
MPPPSIVTDYLDTLARELGFEPALAWRVRTEVADHLMEAVEGDPSGTPEERAARAVRAFGDPRAIARDWVALSLLRQTRRTGAMVIVVTAGMFLGMYARVLWSGMLQLTSGTEFARLAQIGRAVDHVAFPGAFAIGILGWALLTLRSSPAAALDQRWLRWSLRLSELAAAALIVSVATDALLTAIRLDGIAPARVLVPLLSLALEIGLAALLVRDVRAARRRAALLQRFG